MQVFLCLLFLFQLPVENFGQLVGSRGVISLPDNFEYRDEETRQAAQSVAGFARSFQPRANREARLNKQDEAVIRSLNSVLDDRVAFYTDSIPRRPIPGGNNDNFFHTESRVIRPPPENAQRIDNIHPCDLQRADCDVPEELLAQALVRKVTESSNEDGIVNEIFGLQPITNVNERGAELRQQTGLGGSEITQGAALQHGLANQQGAFTSFGSSSGLGSSSSVSIGPTTTFTSFGPGSQSGLGAPTTSIGLGHQSGIGTSGGSFGTGQSGSFIAFGSTPQSVSPSGSLGIQSGPGATFTTIGQGLHNGGLGSLQNSLGVEQQAFTTFGPQLQNSLGPAPPMAARQPIASVPIEGVDRFTPFVNLQG